VTDSVNHNSNQAINVPTVTNNKSYVNSRESKNRGYPPFHGGIGIQIPSLYTPPHSTYPKFFMSRIVPKFSKVNINPEFLNVNIDGRIFPCVDCSENFPPTDYERNFPPAKLHQDLGALNGN